MHLRSLAEHGEKCTEKSGCAAGCGFKHLDESLRAPLTAADAAEDERLKARADAVLAGDI
ncbi:hypothetical protein OHQ88_10540 [Micromonospora zamorensis]|uniref:hypothetical protein n=1 Tax=Micromonospora zamorensis TaxID=709883 RepID=UPI002E22FBD5